MSSSSALSAGSQAFQAPDYIEAIAPYQPGKPISELARELGLDPKTIVKLASNENPLGLAPSAREAMIANLDALSRYPDAAGFELRAALAAHYQVPAAWITLGNGSNDLLELASLALLEAGDGVVYSQHAFVVYHLATQARGARHIMVPSLHYGHDLAAMRQAIDDGTRLVFIANPNNPTGTFLPADDIAQFLEQVQADHGERVTIVLDEAYNEYLAPELQFDSTQWVEQYPNLIVTRTFSKAYGLAGLRLGFALAQPRLTDLLNRVRQPFNANSLAQAAAIAVLNDTDYLAKTYEVNRSGKAMLEQAFQNLGLEYVPSHANFILVKVGERAAQINQALLKQGVIVRPVAADGLPEWLRVSIGLPEENQRFIDALSACL